MNDKEIVLTENLEEGFERALAELKGMAEKQEITPWYSYDVISKDELSQNDLEFQERYYVNLHGLGVKSGAGEIVHQVIIDLFYYGEIDDDLKKIKITFFE
ncbi:hypothetical protein [Natranaerobius thermophilus]|uniref:Uncharacterized protein n=1 Tax=Natranaerobius thermophilus (strain ATCC BAA-1301 / DSM 18059 / JW/NM-WN-LF) TaxID=457570 RepID=B2A8B7_NATTJ|nr:hypothetical protein [Natranaerobius thermophilus]ACB84483.1 hypothetical protein Nther_0898 [Natranaerobius thermophilus JW/NM-WN-LF]